MTAIGNGVPTGTGSGAPERRFAVGAEPGSERRTHVRVWAPARRRVTVVHGNRLAERSELRAEEAKGYFSGWVAGLEVGGRYAFLLDDDAHPYPDPASRFQPEGPH